jgi:hypothetical protein
MFFSLMSDGARIEHPVEAIKPTIRPKGKAARQFMCVVPAKTRDDNLGLSIGLQIGPYLVEK